MALTDYIKKNRRETTLWSVEILTLLYMLFTTLLTLYHWNGMESPMTLIATRIMMLTAMVLCFVLYWLHPCRALKILRFLPPLLGLIFWYPETYDFCSQLPYLDHVFAGIDHTLFGCQPALLFSQAMPSSFWSEAFNMGYYAYYYMMGATLLFYLFARYEQADRAGFIFLGSFFAFYIIYEFLPVAGPQYYFKAIGTAAAETGTFPDIGHYFQHHTEMLKPEIKGIFSQLVLGAQEVGERPTAAFPSSHVGMSTVTMLLARKTKNRRLFWLMAPLYLLLCCGTVYIKAHYLIDSIAGFFCAILLYWAMNKLYWRKNSRNQS